MNMLQLVGKRLQILVSDPWEFGTECLTGVEIDGNATKVRSSQQRRLGQVEEDRCHDDFAQRLGRTNRQGYKNPEFKLGKS